MNKYGQYCPTARASEILGDRWTLLIVRDLLFGAHHFNELERGLPGIPKGLLADRLRRLERVGVLQRWVEPGGRKTCYLLTEAGRDLLPVVESLTRWGARWAFGDPDPDELQPVLLLWWMRDRIVKDQLPGQRVVIEFSFREIRPPCYWLVLSPADVSVCLTHPGFEIDLLVKADLSMLYRVWMGQIGWEEAMRRQQVHLDGQASLIHAFPSWFALSHAAGIVREETSVLRDASKTAVQTPVKQGDGEG